MLKQSDVLSDSLMGEVLRHLEDPDLSVDYEHNVHPDDVLEDLLIEAQDGFQKAIRSGFPDAGEVPRGDIRLTEVTYKNGFDARQDRIIHFHRGESVFTLAFCTNPSMNAGTVNFPVIDKRLVFALSETAVRLPFRPTEHAPFVPRLRFRRTTTATQAPVNQINFIGDGVYHAVPPLEPGCRRVVFITGTEPEA